MCCYFHNNAYCKSNWGHQQNMRQFQIMSLVPHTQVGTFYEEIIWQGQNRLYEHLKCLLFLIKHIFVLAHCFCFFQTIYQRFLIGCPWHVLHKIDQEGRLYDAMPPIGSDKWPMLTDNVRLKWCINPHDDCYFVIGKLLLCVLTVKNNANVV